MGSCAWSATSSSMTSMRVARDPLEEALSREERPVQDPRREAGQAAPRSARNRRITRARRGPASAPAGQHLLVGQGRTGVPGTGVGDERDAAHLEARPTARRCTRGPSTSRPRARRTRPASGPRPASRSSARSARCRCPPRAGRPRRSPAACSRSRRRGLQASVRSGNRGPSESAFGPMSGFCPVRLMWSRHDHQRARPERRDRGRPPRWSARRSSHRVAGTAARVR